MVDRRERLAVAVEDLDYMDPALRQKLEIAKRVNVKQPIVVKEAARTDFPVRKTPAVVFSCDLLTAALVCDIIRNENRRFGDTPCRVYILRCGTPDAEWTRLPDNAILTHVTMDPTGSMSCLNPRWFPVEVRPEDLVPPAPEAVKLGDG